MAAPWLWRRPGNLPAGRTGETGSQSPCVGASLSFISSTTSTKEGVISSGNLEAQGEVAAFPGPFPDASCIAPHSQPGASSPVCRSSGPLPPPPLQASALCWLSPSLPSRPPSLSQAPPLHFSPARSQVCHSPHPAPPLPKLDCSPPPTPVSLQLPLWFALPHLFPCMSLPLCVSPSLSLSPISPSSPSLSPCCLSSLSPCVHPVPLSLTNPPLAPTHLSPSTFLFPFIHSQSCVVHMTSCPSPWLSPPPPPDSDSLPSFSAPTPPSPLLSLQAPSRSACLLRAPSLAAQPCRLGAQTEPASILHSLGQGGRGPGTGSAGGRNLPAQSRGSRREALRSRPSCCLP